MRVDVKAGYAFAAAAIVASGSFLVPYRFIYPGRYATHPLIFHLYASIGIFIAHWLSQAFLPLNPEFVDKGSSHFHFSRLGVVAGVILAFGLAFNYASTAKIGMALTQAISSGAAVISSYLWATVVFEETPSILWLSIFGIILIVTGITSISFSRQTTPTGTKSTRSGLRYNEISPGLADESKDERPKFSFEGEEILFGSHTRTGTRLEEGQESGVTESLLAELHRQAVWIDTQKYLVGVTCALVSGLLGGSVLVPLHYVPHQEKGLAFLPSFSLAALLCAPVILLLYLLNPFGRQKEFPHTYFTETFGLSMMSGVLWSIGNICAIGAIDRLGYGIALPLIQLSVVIAALWGFVCFGEFRSEDGKTNKGEGFFFASRKATRTPIMT
ncbi:hypothetical protein EON65_57260, partial [archaeon]